MDNPLPRRHMDTFTRVATALFLIVVVSGCSEAQATRDRIITIRNNSTHTEPYPMLVLDEVKLDNRDYALILAELMSARRNFPNVSEEQLTEYRWFAANPDLDHKYVLNGHSVIEGDKTIPEDLGLYVVKQEYRAPVEEVIWQYQQIHRLGLLNERANRRNLIEVINRLAERQPWERK